MERPIPPTRLSESGAERWRAIVESSPWNRFLAAPVQIQLEMYCRCSSRCNDIAAALETADPGSSTFRQLVNLEAKQSGLLMAIARSLGVTKQQTMKAEVAATASRKNTPTILAELYNFRDEDE